MKVLVHQVTAALNMPRGYLKQGKRASDIITASTANTYVTVPDATLTAAKTQLAAFINAPTAAERKAALRPLIQSLQGIMVFFQAAANADPANAQVILESGGFKPKAIAIPEKQSFKLSNGLISGSIKLQAPGGGQRTCHDWKYSADGVTFTRMAPTVNARTEMDGLTVGKYAYFTHELITKNGGQGVSEVQKILVR